MQIYEVTHYLPYVCPNCESYLAVIGTSMNGPGRLVVGLLCSHCDRAVEVELVFNEGRNTHAEGYAQYELYLDTTNPYLDDENARRFTQGVNDAKKDEIPF